MQRSSPWSRGQVIGSSSDYRGQVQIINPGAKYRDSVERSSPKVRRKDHVKVCVQVRSYVQGFYLMTVSIFFHILFTACRQYLAGRIDLVRAENTFLIFVPVPRSPSVCSFIPPPFFERDQRVTALECRGTIL